MKITTPAARDIKLRVHDESELFSPLDPDQNMLSDDVIDYLSRVFLNKHRRLRESFVIHIITDVPVENEEHIKAAIYKEGARRKDDIRYALKQLMIKLIILAVLGAAILALWLYLSATRETVGVEILSIMGWVLVWEATSIFVLQRPELWRSWLNIDRLTRAEIVFHAAQEQNRTETATPLPGNSDGTETEVLIHEHL